MIKRWWCLDCGTSVDLNNSGRCGICDSDAVDILNACDVRLQDSSRVVTVAPPQKREPLFVKLAAFLRSDASTSLSSLVRSASAVPNGNSQDGPARVN